MNDGTVPTAIFTSSTNGQSGFVFLGGVLVQVEDIKFTNYTVNGTTSVRGTSLGILADARSDLYARNLFISGCDIGLKSSSESKVRVQAGIYSGNATGFIGIDHTTFSIGYNGTAADITGANGPAFLNNTVTGIQLSEGSHGHIDYTYIGMNPTGAVVSLQSSAHFVGSTIANNTIGVSVETNASWLDNQTTVNTFTGNSTNVSTRSGGVHSVLDHSLFNPGFRLIDTSGASTSSLTPVTIFTKVFTANELSNRGAGFHLRLLFDVVGSAGTKNVTITLGTTTILNHTIASATGDYTVEVDFWNRTAASSQKALVRVFENGGTQFVEVTPALAQDLTVSKTLAVTHNVANGADTNRLQVSELSVTR